MLKMEEKLSILTLGSSCCTAVKLTPYNQKGIGLTPGRRWSFSPVLISQSVSLQHFLKTSRSQLEASQLKEKRQSRQSLRV